MKNLIVNSAGRLAECIATLTNEFEANHWLKVSISSGKRSLDANALSHVFYKEIGEHTGQTPEEARCECKLRYGVPILREDDKASAFFSHIGFDDWRYEKQLAAMKYLEVTRLFDPEQMRRYLDTMQREYAKHGLVLESNK